MTIIDKKAGKSGTVLSGGMMMAEPALEPEVSFKQTLKQLTNEFQEAWELVVIIFIHRSCNHPIAQ